MFVWGKKTMEIFVNLTNNDQMIMMVLWFLLTNNYIQESEHFSIPGFEMQIHYY